MVALLTEEKRRLIAANGHVTLRDFDEAWERCWDIMKREHAWAHLTRERRGWRQAQRRTKPELRAAFLDLPTPFSYAAGRLQEAAAAMCLQLEPGDLGKALLAAVAYVEVEDTDRAALASDAACAFMQQPIDADGAEEQHVPPRVALPSLAQ